MSRRRLSPTQWLDEGPSSARHHGHTYTTRNIEGALVGSMKPILTNGGNYVENRRRVKVAQAFSIHPENRRELCDAPLLAKGWTREPTGERCGRIFGHHDTHRSPATMAEEAARRRTGHRVSA